MKSLMLSEKARKVSKELYKLCLEFRMTPEYKLTLPPEVLERDRGRPFFPRQEFIPYIRAFIQILTKEVINKPETSERKDVLKCAVKLIENSSQLFTLFDEAIEMIGLCAPKDYLRKIRLQWTRRMVHTHISDVMPDTKSMDISSEEAVTAAEDSTDQPFEMTQEEPELPKRTHGGHPKKRFKYESSANNSCTAPTPKPTESHLPKRKRGRPRKTSDSQEHMIIPSLSEKVNVKKEVNVSASEAKYGIHEGSTNEVISSRHLRQKKCQKFVLRNGGKIELLSKVTEAQVQKQESTCTAAPETTIHKHSDTTVSQRTLPVKESIPEKTVAVVMVSKKYPPLVHSRSGRMVKRKVKADYITY